MKVVATGVLNSVTIRVWHRTGARPEVNMANRITEWMKELDDFITYLLKNSALCPTRSTCNQEQNKNNTLLPFVQSQVWWKFQIRKHKWMRKKNLRLKVNDHIVSNLSERPPHTLQLSHCQGSRLYAHIRSDWRSDSNPHCKHHNVFSQEDSYFTDNIWWGWQLVFVSYWLIIAMTSPGSLIGQRAHCTNLVRWDRTHWVD